MFILLSAFWFIRTSKYVLFWLYLWQLKEYHIGRFLAHFETQKGLNLIFNSLQNFKIAMVIIFLLDRTDLHAWFLFLVYFIESFSVFRALFNKKIKKPKLTQKTFFLLLFSFLIVILFPITLYIFSQDIIKFSLYLLVFDILTPFIIAAVVLLFQPLAVLIRNNIIRKAKRKIKKLKSITGRPIVVGITGSYGKTSTKEFLSAILSYKFEVLKTKEHQNSEIGISKCILNDLSSSHQVFIAEVGAYNKGKVKEVCSVLEPSIGIVTGVNEQHLALFGSMENLLSAEGGRELAEFLEKEGLLIVNGDNKYCLDLVKRFNGAEKIYSEKNKFLNTDIWTENISVFKDSISFIAINKKREMVDFSVNVLGKQNVQNLLGAILAATELGMALSEIAEACKAIKQEQAGMLLKQGKHGINVIDSSYSANPDGVFADLDYLSIFEGKKVIVMPCLIELGKKSSEIHEKIGRKIAEICDLAIITSKDKFKELKRGALQGGMKEKNILFCDNPQDIYSAITLFCKSNDAVLLEGRVPSGLTKLLSE